MKFANGYNFIYEKQVETAEETERKLFASKEGKPTDTDKELTYGVDIAEVKAAKLVYNKDDNINISTSGIPAVGDPTLVIASDGELVLVPSNTEIIPAEAATTEDLLQAIADGANYITLGADLTTDKNAPIIFNHDAIVNLSGKTIESTDDVALRANSGATLTIIGDGTIAAREGCAMAFNGSTVIVNSGTFNCSDNFVFGTNGSSGVGKNTIVINGGTFDGNIESAGYIACGIYVANDDEVIVNGGTFNVVDGVGVLARSGKTTIGKNVVFNVTGDGTLGKVGDSQVTVPSGEVLVLDLKAKYPGGTPVLINNSDYSVYTIEPDAE